MAGHVGLVALLCGLAFIVLAVVAITYVVRREFRRRSDLAALAASLGLRYLRGVDPWQVGGPGAQVDESATGVIDGVPVALVTHFDWVGSGGPVGSGAPSRRTWTVSAVPVAGEIDPRRLHVPPGSPVRLRTRPGWLLIGRDRRVQLIHAAAGVREARWLLSLAVELGRQVPLRDPGP